MSPLFPAPIGPVAELEKPGTEKGGILVDDAIVVVENVERLMSEEGLSPEAATRKSMHQINRIGHRAIKLRIACALQLASCIDRLCFRNRGTQFR